MIGEWQQDPHMPNTEWRYHEKWGLQWRGESPAHEMFKYETGDLSGFVASRERIRVWAQAAGVLPSGVSSLPLSVAVEQAQEAIERLAAEPAPPALQTTPGGAAR